MCPHLFNGLQNTSVFYNVLAKHHIKIRGINAKQMNLIEIQKVAKNYLNMHVSLT